MEAGVYPLMDSSRTATYLMILFRLFSGEHVESHHWHGGQMQANWLHFTLIESHNMLQPTGVVKQIPSDHMCTTMLFSYLVCEICLVYYINLQLYGNFNTKCDGFHSPCTYINNRLN